MKSKIIIFLMIWVVFLFLLGCAKPKKSGVSGDEKSESSGMVSQAEIDSYFGSVDSGIVPQWGKTPNYPRKKPNKVILTYVVLSSEKDWLTEMLGMSLDSLMDLAPQTFQGWRLTSSSTLEEFIVPQENRLLVVDPTDSNGFSSGEKIDSLHAIIHRNSYKGYAFYMRSIVDHFRDHPNNQSQDSTNQANWFSYVLLSPCFLNEVPSNPLEENYTDYVGFSSSPEALQKSISQAETQDSALIMLDHIIESLNKNDSIRTGSPLGINMSFSFGSNERGELLGLPLSLIGVATIHYTSAPAWEGGKLFLSRLDDSITKVADPNTDYRSEKIAIREWFDGIYSSARNVLTDNSGHEFHLDYPSYNRVLAEKIYQVGKHEVTHAFQRKSFSLSPSLDSITADKMQSFLHCGNQRCLMYRQDLDTNSEPTKRYSDKVYLCVLKPNTMVQCNSQGQCNPETENCDYREIGDYSLESIQEHSIARGGDIKTCRSHYSVGPQYYFSDKIWVAGDKEFKR